MTDRARAEIDGAVATITNDNPVKRNGGVHGSEQVNAAVMRTTVPPTHH